MIASRDPVLSAWSRRGARVASLIVLAAAASGMCGAVFRMPMLQRLVAGLATMKLSTALSLGLLGVALWRSIADPPARRRIARGLAVFVALVAAASLIEYAGIDLRIDELIVRDPDSAVAPGRPAMMTACSLMMLGVLLAWLDARWAAGLNIAVALIAHLMLLGYLYGAADLYAIGPLSTVSLPTAVALYLLAIGALLARPDRGLIRVMITDAVHGVLARRLIPAALILPAALALVRQAGETAGLYGTGFGRALLVAANSVCFIALIWRTAVVLGRSEAERRRAEAATAEREEQLAITLDSIGDGVIATDGAGRVVRMNAVAERLTGWSGAAAANQPLDQVFRITSEDSGAPVESPVDHVLRDGIVVGLANHTILTSRDGTARAIADSGAPIRDAHGATRGVVLVFQDQTEARAADHLLRASEARLRTLAEVSDAFASVATSYDALVDQIARTVSRQIGDGCLVTLLSESGDQLRNVANAHRDPVIEVAYRTYLDQVSVSVLTSTSVSATVARTGQPRRGDVAPQTLVDQADEALRPLVAQLNVHSFAVVPIRARQAIIGTLSLVRSTPGAGYTDADLILLGDLADRAGLAIDNARTYAQLEQRVRERTAEFEAANGELVAFSYSVAHDLRAPLRSLAGFSRALIEDHAERLPADGVDYLQRIDVAARRMSRLIDDLLELSHAGRVALDRRLVDVSRLVDAAIARLAAAQPGRDVEVIVPANVVADADPGLLDIALTNLISNAWKFTGKRDHATIELGVQPSDPPTYFVRDNGAGFPSDQADRLFDVFTRLHAARDFEGTGIGLATTRRIITRHGGRIWAEGAPDVGATVFFTLAASAPAR